MEAKPYLKEVIFQREDVFSFDSYPFNIPAIAKLTSLKFHPDVTFIVGENGTGKSTLVEAIALKLGFGIEGGTKNVQIQTHHNNGSDLFNYLKAIKSFKTPRDNYFLRAESFYNVATYMEEVNYLAGYGRRSLHQQSQFIIATHSPILLAYPNATIYRLNDSGIHKINYEETEHYMVTKYFLNNYKEMVKNLMME